MLLVKKLYLQSYIENNNSYKNIKDHYIALSRIKNKHDVYIDERLNKAIYIAKNLTVVGCNPPIIRAFKYYLLNKIKEKNIVKLIEKETDNFLKKSIRTLFYISKEKNLNIEYKKLYLFSYLKHYLQPLYTLKTLLLIFFTDEIIKTPVNEVTLTSNQLTAENISTAILLSHMNEVIEVKKHIYNPKKKYINAQQQLQENSYIEKYIGKASTYFVSTAIDILNNLKKEL